MNNILIRLLINALIILLISKFLIGFVVPSFFTAFLVALVLGIINVTIKPVLILFTLPINILTLGLFTFVINALLLLLTSLIVKGFEIDGFFPAFVAGLLISAFNILFRRFESRPFS